jgi:hypothetical protein
MTDSFDLTSTAKLESHDNEQISHLAAKVRNASPEFDGSDSQDDVVRAVLSDYLTELSEASQEAESLQDDVRGRLGLTEEAQDTPEKSEHTRPAEAAEGNTEAENKQAEIRNRILD